MREEIGNTLTYLYTLKGTEVVDIPVPIDLGPTEWISIRAQMDHYCKREGVTMNRGFEDPRRLPTRSRVFHRLTLSGEVDKVLPILEWLRKYVSQDPNERNRVIPRLIERNELYKTGARQMWANVLNLPMNLGRRILDLIP